MLRSMIRAAWVLVLAGVVLSPACQRAANGPGGRGRAHAPRVVVVGLDGADWQIIDRLEAEGRVPNLSRLRREGAWGVLRSEAPLISPVVWTTIATGRSPLDHGIFGFLTRRDGVEEPVRSDERAVRAFWNIASEAGQKVGVLGWYATWPAEPVNGFLVADRAGVHQVPGADARPDTGLAWPADLASEVERVRRDVEQQVGPAEASRIFPAGSDVTVLPADKRDALLGVARTTEMQRRLFWPLVERHRPAIAAVYFEGTDSVGHLLADYAAPGAPGADPRLVKLFGAGLEDFYAHIDGILGEIVAPLDAARTSVIVVSDHGFRTGPLRPHGLKVMDVGNQAPQWHRPQGVILLWGRGVVTGARVEPSSIYDVLPTLLRLAGLPVSRRLPGEALEPALTPEVRVAPVQWVDDYESRGAWARTPPPPRAADDAAAAERIEQLRALGYVGAASSEPGAGGAQEGQASIALNVHNRALLLEEAGRHEEALATFRELQQRWPDLLLGFYGEGLVRFRQGRVTDAIPALERAARLGDDVALTHALLGEAYFRARKPKEAAASLARAIDLDPGLARPMLLLARLHLLSRRPDEAARLLERARDAAEMPGERGAALADLALIAEMRDQPAHAEALLREALTVAPGLPEALERCAALLIKLKRPVEALPLLEQLVREQPRNARALTLTAYALAGAGRRQEAREALSRSLQIAPAQPDARRLLESLGS